MVKFIPYNKALTKKARENRKAPSCAEAKLWCEVLRGKCLHGYKFQRQKPLLDFIVDFYCVDLGLVVEVDGDSHAAQVDYDRARTESLEEYGLKVIRYFNNEVMCNLDGVYEHLQKVVFDLKKTHPGSPLSGREK